MPGIWYQAALQRGDRFARGATMPGLPGVYMGQNNDLAWTFTNVMADVQDLFVERVEGDRYLFEDEWRPLEIVREEIAVKGRGEPERSRCAPPTTGRSSTRRSAPTPPSRWRCAGSPSTSRPPTRRCSSCSTSRSGPELVEMLVRPHDAGLEPRLGRPPRLDRLQAGRPAAAPPRRLPGPAEAGPDGEFEWDGVVPYEELPELTDPESDFLVTANNRIVGDEYPHHITSEWLDGFRARGSSSCCEASDEHDLESFEEMQTDDLSIPGLEAARRLGRLAPRDQREQQAIELLRSWDGRLDPDSVAASIYQAFLLRLAREVARSAIGDRDLAERWLDRADNGFTAHVTSPWRWHSHLMDLWAEADPQLVGRAWDDLVLDALRGGLDDLAERFGSDPAGWRWGRVHEMRVPAPARRRQPAARPAAQPPAARRRRRRRRSPRSPTTPAIPTGRSGRRAGGWSPTRSTPSARAGRCSPASRGTRQPPLRRPAGRLARGAHPADGGRGAVEGAAACPGLTALGRRP